MNLLIGGVYMNKKIFTLLTLFVVIASISAASAIDLNDLSTLLSGDSNANSTANATVNVSGVTFNIPAGFVEADNVTVGNESNNSSFIDYDMISKGFINGSADVILISVSSSDNISVNDSLAETLSLGGNKTTINGVEGYESSAAGIVDFTYSKDGKLVSITVSNDKLLKDIIA